MCAYAEIYTIGACVCDVCDVYVHMLKPDVLNARTFLA
jgi:hypothetical protein